MKISFPDLLDRAERHQCLADLHVVAGVEIPSRDHAVDLGDDVAVPEVHLGQVEVVARLADRGLGLLDRRGLAGELLQDHVDVAVLVLPVQFIQHLLGPRLARRQGLAELRQHLHHVGQGDADGRERLVEVRRHVGEILALGGLGRQPQPDADLVHLRERLVRLRLGHLDLLSARVQLLEADRPRAISFSARAKSLRARSRVARRLWSVATPAFRAATWLSTCSMAVRSFQRRPRPVASSALAWASAWTRSSCATASRASRRWTWT